MNQSPTKSHWGQIHSGTLLIACLWMLVLLVEAQSFAPNARQYAPQQYRPPLSAIAGFAGSTVRHLSAQDALYRKEPLPRLPVKAELKPQISPYNWQAQYNSGQLIVSGYAPSQNDRDAILEVARATFDRSPIIDKMLVGAGEPHGWLPTVVIAIRQLAMLKEGNVSLENTKLSIAGIAQRQETAELIRSALRTEVAALYTVQHDIAFLEATIPVVRPFKSTIIFKNNTFSFDGRAPDKAMLDPLIATIESARPKAAIVNRMTIARGAPEGWLNCMQAGLNSLLELDEGGLEVVDRELTLTGLTRDEELGELLPKKLRAAVNRSCREIVKLHVEVPPEPNLDWYAKHIDNVLAMGGEVPDATVQNELVKLAGELFPGSKPSFNLSVNSARSEKWPRVAKMALQSLAKLRSGEARLTAQILTVTGEAEDTATATAIHQHLKAGLAKGYQAVVQIEVKSAAMLWAEREAKRNEKTAPVQANPDRVQTAPQPGQAEKAPSLPQRKVAIQQAERQRCQKALDEAMRTGTISFPAGSDTFGSDSLATLDRLSDLSDPCKAHIEIEIAGHTDSQGSAASNRELSERRAQTVRAYLIEHGLPAAQLSARGYGEMQPLVPNTTPDNMARNRRIEFRVKID